jgi:hypothetical protein
MNWIRDRSGPPRGVFSADETRRQRGRVGDASEAICGEQLRLTSVKRTESIREDDSSWFVNWYRGK